MSALAGALPLWPDVEVEVGVEVDGGVVVVPDFCVELTLWAAVATVLEDDELVVALVAAATVVGGVVVVVVTTLWALLVGAEAVEAVVALVLAGEVLVLLVAADGAMAAESLGLAAAVAAEGEVSVELLSEEPQPVSEAANANVASVLIIEKRYRVFISSSLCPRRLPYTM